MAPFHAPSPRSRASFAAAALAWAAPALAVTLGDIDVRSSPGQPLEARVALTASAGEDVEATCFRVARGRRESGPFVAGARLALVQGPNVHFLVVRTAAPVSDPGVVLRIVVACPGPEVRAWRDYRRLFDPRPVIAPPAAVPAIAPARDPGASSAPGLVAREGDTLASLSTAIFPHHRKARRAYLEALREQNAALASLADRDPIPPATIVVLPDLRTFARGRDLREDAAASPAVAAAKRAPPKPAAEPLAAKAPEGAAAAPVRERVAKAPEAPRPLRGAAPASPARPAGPASGATFVLRLSAPEVDLSRSRGVDDRLRAQLRERLLVLDSDDQVAALLSLKHSLKQLEGRVAELQLKLAGMPAALQGAAGTPVPAARSPAPVTNVPEPAVPVAKTPDPPVVPAAIAPPAPATEVKPALRPEPKPEPKLEPKPEPKLAPVPESKPEPRPRPEATPKLAAPPSEPAPAVSKPAPATVPAPLPPKPREPAADRYPDWLWAVVVLLAAAAAWIGWRLWRSRSGPRPSAEPESAFLPQSEPVAGDSGELEIAAELPEPRLPPPPAAPPTPARRTIASDADLATAVPTGDPVELRRRYLAQRFPEIANRTIALDQPDSVVKGARLLYEDGALPRAVELLQFAIEEKPAEVKPWLALFEIFRLQGLSGEFAALAGRFREHHGGGDYWHKVQYFGRELDPANPLYREPAIDQLETIGIAASRKLPPAPAFDPLAENWLDAPMDFNDEVLANELRKSVMAQAGLTERDLIPNPMPALRNVEMFTVA